MQAAAAAAERRDFVANSPARAAALAAIIYQQQIILAFQKLRENAIEPILIKGWSIEQFYPVDKKRKTADIDLCVAPDDYKKAKLIIESLGFAPENFDLHCGLRDLDVLPWADLLNNSRLIKLHHALIRVLRPEDNLRVTCVHWLNDGGAEREKLWDIFYLVLHRPANFDWERCLDSNGRKRRRWILCALASAHFYVSLPIVDTPFAAEIKTVLPQWFIPALEKEWNDPVKIIKLEKFLLKRDWKSLRQQLKKRFSPNVIGASVELNAPFNNIPRWPIQFADIIFRFIVHSKRNAAAIFKLLQIKRNY